MNGFISRKAVRFTLLFSACLLTGFVSGKHYGGFNFEAIFPKKEINYAKISWFSNTFEQSKISTAKIVYPSSELTYEEIKLSEFHLPPRKQDFKKNKNYHHNFKKLSDVLVKINTFDLFNDYRNASEKMQKNFILVMSSPLIKTDSVVIAASSAIKKEIPALKTTKINPIKIKKVQSLVRVKRHREESLTNKMSIQKMNTQNVIKNKIPILSKLETNSSSKPLRASDVPLVVKSEQSSAILKNDIKDEINKSVTETIGNKMENQLLDQQIQNYNLRQITTNQVAAITSVKQPAPHVQIKHPEDEIDHNNDVQNNISDDANAFVSKSTECKILPKLHLIKPIQGDIVENNQICPLQKKWISKSWGDEGWVKVDTEGYFPLLTYYPQLSSNKTLLLDQNSIALLAIKSGIHFAHGMGIIFGTVPQGFKIEFSGRSEEVQYFEFNSKKYFVILNVEPGAGVVELVSEKNQEENATVFTPVLSDVMTYLDLSTPISASIPIKVVKSDSQKTDVSGLTIGISTQTQAQAITQQDGTAILQNVRLIPGYPVFVDVSSKLNGERSYQYRYQLNKRTRRGVFVLRQYPEKTIFQWLKQIKYGLSDQSAMIFGQFGNKIDAFKNHYTVRVESITEKFGLEAKSYTVLFDEKLNDQYPLEGMNPRFLSVQVPEGLAQAHLVNENNQIIQTSLIPVSPRVINVVSE